MSTANIQMYEALKILVVENPQVSAALAAGEKQVRQDYLDQIRTTFSDLSAGYSLVNLSGLKDKTLDEVKKALVLAQLYVSCIRNAQSSNDSIVSGGRHSKAFRTECAKQFEKHVANADRAMAQFIETVGK